MDPQNTLLNKIGNSMRDRVLGKQLNWAGIQKNTEEKPIETAGDVQYASKADFVELKR